MSTYIVTQDALTLLDERGYPHTFNLSELPTDTVNEAVHLIQEDKLEEALKKLSPRRQIESFFDNVGDVTIQDGTVLYQGRPVDDYAARRALEFAHQGLPYQPLLRFIERVRQNPSYRAIQELYQFLETGNMPLTHSGRFVAYKKVRRRNDGHLVAIADSSFINDPGTVVEIPRNEVDEDPTNICSAGLHVCSYGYLPHFGSGSWDIVVSVEVDPADVVAVPHDYRNSKMRVCRYRVLDTLPDYNEDYLSQYDLYDVEDEDEGWIENDDSGAYDDPPNGVDPFDVVEVEYRDDTELPARARADCFDWDIDNNPRDIVRYRIVERAA